MGLEITPIIGDPARDMGFLGFWECDFQSETVRASGLINSLFGCTQAAGTEAPLASYLLRIHPDDERWLSYERLRSIGQSGHGVTEYRMFDENGSLHWVMCRGRYRLDHVGKLLDGYGMLIDVTSFKEDENTIRTAPSAIVNPLNHLVDLTIEAFSAAQQVGDNALVEALRAALIVAARLLARKITKGVDAAEGSTAN